MTVDGRRSRKPPLWPLAAWREFLQHEDPFASLDSSGRDVQGWVGGQVAESLERGSCPLCDSRESATENYLYWLQANLRDAEFLLLLSDTGLYCLPHLDTVFASLKDFPYSEVQLFNAVKSALEAGPRRGRKPCHLCAVLEQSEQVYMHAIKGMKGDESLNRRYGKINFHLCGPHAGRPLTGSAEKVITAGSKTNWESGLRPVETSSLQKELAMMLESFHLMPEDELRRALARCEAFMRKAWKDGR